MLKLYLDSSVMLKRYLSEQGTETTDIIFDKAETGELTITFSLWNIGEAIGVLDEKRRKAWLTEKEFRVTLNNFADELVKLSRLKTLEVIPLLTPNPHRHMGTTDEPSHIRGRRTSNHNLHPQQKRCLN